MKTKYLDYYFTYTPFKVQGCMRHGKPEPLRLRPVFSFVIQFFRLTGFLSTLPLCIFIYISELYVQLCDTFPLTSDCH